jgi:hypothetical protein
MPDVSGAIAPAVSEEPAGLLCEDHRMSGTDYLPAITPAQVAARALQILAGAR